MIQYGAVTHLAAMLTDRGVPASRAALAVSVFGGASLVGRLLAGTLLDRFYAPRVAFGLLLAASAGAALLAQAASVSVAMVAAFLVGLLAHYRGWLKPDPEPLPAAAAAGSAQKMRPSEDASAAAADRG